MPRRHPTHKLTDEMRRFLVNELACFSGPAEALEAMAKEFPGAPTINVKKVRVYLRSTKWKAFHDSQRKAFLDHASDEVPETHKAVRVKRLAEFARVLQARGNLIAAADMLERIAKELGNVHSNRRELTGKDGGPVAFKDATELTDEEIDRELGQLLRLPGPETVN